MKERKSISSINLLLQQHWNNILKLGLSIVPVYIERLENNFFNIEFLNEIKPTDYKEINQKLNQILIHDIKNLYQWI